jgi:hypothetical protein
LPDACPAHPRRESSYLVANLGWGSGMEDAVSALLATARGRRFPTILADPPWQFQNKTGKVAPEHRRLSRYGRRACR